MTSKHHISFLLEESSSPSPPFLHPFTHAHHLLLEPISKPSRRSSRRVNPPPTLAGLHRGASVLQQEILQCLLLWDQGQHVRLHLLEPPFFPESKQSFQPVRGVQGHGHPGEVPQASLPSYLLFQGDSPQNFR